jgi:hypothetical protein
MNHYDHDGREIEAGNTGTAGIYLRGSSALARDVSVFQVDGKSYSARRAMKKNVADNDFIPMPASAEAATKRP